MIFSFDIVFCIWIHQFEFVGITQYVSVSIQFDFVVIIVLRAISLVANYFLVICKIAVDLVETYYIAVKTFTCMNGISAMSSFISSGVGSTASTSASTFLPYKLNALQKAEPLSVTTCVILSMGILKS